MRSLETLVSRFPPIQRKLETRGNETGNERETKSVLLCIIGNGQRARDGNEGTLFCIVRFQYTFHFGIPCARVG